MARSALSFYILSQNEEAGTCAGTLPFGQICRLAEYMYHGGGLYLLLASRITRNPCPDRKPASHRRPLDPCPCHPNSAGYLWQLRVSVRHSEMINHDQQVPKTAPSISAPSDSVGRWNGSLSRGSSLLASVVPGTRETELRHRLACLLFESLETVGGLCRDMQCGTVSTPACCKATQ